MLIPNGTLFIQIANFLLLLFLLNLLLYRPIRKVLARRRQELGDLAQGVADLNGRAESSSKAIEESMAKARKDGFVEKENMKGEAVKEEHVILQDAASAVEKRLEKARADLEVKMNEVRKALEGQVEAFSKDFAEKILGRAV